MSGTMSSNARSYLDEDSKIRAGLDVTAIDRFGDLIYKAWQDGRRVLVFGNGGSASTASHYVCDFVKTAAVDGERHLDAMCLNDNVGLLTAVGNDISYEDTFRYPLEVYAKPGDLAVAISCSGNSSNIVAACRWARDHELAIVAISGFAGGAFAELADLHINIPSDNYGIIEDCHLSVGHMVTQRLHALVGGQLS